MEVKHMFVFTKNSKESRFGPGWAWEDYDAYFSPEKSTLPLFGNVVTLSNVNGKSVSPQYFTDKVEIKDTTLRRDELQNHFYISPTEQDTLEIPFITNDSLTKDLLENVLRTKVVLTDHFPNVEKRTLYGMETDSIYKDMLFESDNFLAEQLFLQEHLQGNMRQLS